nr:sensor histidine kinase [Mucilaginibacter sp. L294]
MDPAGYLWAGTQSGASLFDGQHFLTLDSQSGLQDNHVTAITAGAGKLTWFGHRSGGLSWYKNGKVSTFTNPGYKNINNVNCLLWYKNTLYVGTSGNGLFALQYKGKSCRVRHYLSAQGLANNIVNKLCIKDDNSVWLATDKGLNVLSVKSQSILPTNFPAVLNQRITAIATRGNTLLCGTENGLVFYEKGVAKQAADLFNNTQVKQAISAIFIDHKNDIWLATNNGAIVITGQIVKVLGQKNGLLGDVVHDIKEDREHGIWLAQDDGLSCFKDSPFELYTNHDGLIYNEVYSVEQDAHQNYWASTTQGITVFKTTASGMQKIRDITKKDGLPDNFVYDMYRDSHNNIWMACAKKGAACYITAQNKFLKFDHGNGLAGKQVVNIGEDKKGRIWLASLDSGIAVYDYTTNKIKSFTKNKGFVSNTVWDIHRDQKGQLWFGTRDKGLVKLDTVTDKFDVIDKPVAGALHDFASVTSDKKGNIWVATIGNGILKYNGRKFEKYGFRNGLKSNNPYFIFCDKKDNIWVGTNIGLDHFDPVTKTTESYLESDGFLGIETNQNAIYQANDGDLWIGTVKGLMHYSTGTKPVKPIAPLVYITKKRLFFDNDSLNSSNLRYNQNYLTFEFAGITLSNADKVRYQYKLQGLSDSWSPMFTDARVSYANLAPGYYKFMVKAGYMEGNWSLPASFSFRIKPPFYFTWWFITLTITLVCLIVCWLYQYRVEQLLKVQRMRNKIAGDLHDDIGSALTSISIFSEVADQQLKKQGLQDTREIIGHIAHHSRSMLEAMDDIVWAVNPKNDHFNDLFIRMREFAIPLLEARAINFDIMIDKDIENTSLPMEYRKNIFLIFKESINNVLKHAQCTAITVLVKPQGKKISFVISDNGKGFETGVESNRNGLKNIERRAAEMGGELTITSSPDKGTMIKLLINII